MSEFDTKWTRREKKVVPPDTRSGNEIIDQERMNKFQRRAAQQAAPLVSDDAAENQNRFERRASARQQQTEGTRNKFGDKLNERVDPREKTGPTAGRRNAATEWFGEGKQTRAVDERTTQLFEEMRQDPAVGDRAAYRKPTEKSAAQPKTITNEEIIAYCNFVIMAHPEVPLDTEVHPGDARWYQAVLTNVTNLKRCWFYLVKGKKVALDLAGLLASFQVCVDQHCFDYAKPRIRGESQPLVNILNEVDPPTAGEPDDLAVLRANIKAGRARVERMRPATPEESQEIVAAKQKDFHTLAAEVRQNYRRD